MDVLCRRCRRVVETLGHISGACTHVLPERMQRHQRVCDQLKTAATSKGFRVMEEPTIVDESGKRHRPDLVLHAGDICYVVDPTVIWDKEMARLEAAYTEKVRKYQAIVPKIRTLYGVSKVEVHGFVIGARGTYCPNNNRIANVLGLKNGHVQTICLKALCDTVKLVQTFFDA